MPRSRGGQDRQVTVAKKLGTVYLLHWDNPSGPALHYTGWTSRTPEERLTEHKAGSTKTTLSYNKRTKSLPRLARIYINSTRADEKVLKKISAVLRCPICSKSAR